MALQHAGSKSKRHAATNGQPARNRHAQKKPLRQSITVQRCITCRCCVSWGRINFHRPLYRSSCQQSTGSGPLSNAWLRSKMYQIDCHHCTLDWRRCASFRRSCARSGGKRQAAFVSVIKRAYRLPARYKRIRNTAIPNIGTHLKERKLKGTANGSRRI